MKPLIGIVPSVDSEGTGSFFPAYIKAIELAGATPIVLPYTESEETLTRLIDLCGGILFIGGGDIEPRRYGEAPSPKLGETTPLRDELELRVFELVMKKNKPIMAICRGAQLVNVALSGSLIQDINSEYKTDISHRQNEDKFEYSHDVILNEGEALNLLIGKKRIPANSFHHQAVKRLGKGLCVTAVAEDGIIEAFKHDSYPYLHAYQWHPERLCQKDEDQLKLFKDFVKASQRKDPKLDIK